MKKNDNFKDLKRLIKQNKRFLVTSHVNLEPDALGSELAFARLLKMLGKQALVVNNEEVADNYRFMPGSESVRSINSKYSNMDFDVAIILDCSDLSRIGKVRNLIRNDLTLVNIDHHVSNLRFADYNFVFEKASSVCEIVYRIFKDFKVKIDKAAAINLYSGIVSDTGSFRYSNTSPETLSAAGELLKFGFDPDRLYRQIYRIDRASHARLIGRLLQQVKTFEGGKVICLVLGLRPPLKAELARDLGEQALNILRLIYGAKVFILLRRIKTSNCVRINMRSNCNIDVNKIARAFKGGGHARAAGATARGDLTAVRTALLKEIRKYL